MFPMKCGVDIFLVQEYLVPRVTYADALDVRTVTLLYRSLICTRYINWIMFVHVVVEGTRVIIITNMAGRVYDYVSFHIIQDKPNGERKRQ